MTAAVLVAPNPDPTAEFMLGTVRDLNSSILRSFNPKTLEK